MAVESVGDNEIEIPYRQSDPMDLALSGWEDAIEELEKSQIHSIEEEANFKSWEAARKLVYIQTHKMSATMAESQVRSSAEWTNRFLEMNQASIHTEKRKRLARLAEARWETERSRQVTLRNVR